MADASTQSGATLYAPVWRLSNFSLMKIQIPIGGLIVGVCLLLSGCNYDFPLTAAPTRKIEVRLLGDWVAIDKESEKQEFMHVRQFDDTTYVVSIDNDIYRVFHSDFADTAFLSVHDLNSPARKYLYYTWHLSAGTGELTLKGVSTSVIPETTKTSAEIQSLIKQQLANPKLFQDELHFRLKKSGN